MTDHPRTPPKQLGWLDTSIFVHPLFENDPHRERCTEILRALGNHTAEGRLDVLVVHELTYVLPRVLPQRFSDRDAVARYVIGCLNLVGIQSEQKQLMITAIQQWAAAGVSFTDARLLALCEASGAPVCTVNRRDFPQVDNTY